MPTYTQEQLQERYEGLPEDLKRAIYGVETADIIQKISKKYQLQIDQMGELAAETGLVMLGFTHPKDYIKNLSGRLGADFDTAKKIAQEINIEIFSKVKEALKKLHGISETETPSESAPISKPPTPPVPQQMTEVSSPSEIEIAPKDLETPFPSTSTPPVSPVKLTQKHEPSSKPETKLSPPPPPKESSPPLSDNGKNAGETVKTDSLPIEVIFPEKIQEQPFRRPSQTTEIKSSATGTPVSEKYPSGDPYKESLEK